MTRFRKWLVTTAIVLSLLISFSPVATADSNGRRGGAPHVETCLDPLGSGTCIGW